MDGEDYYGDGASAPPAATAEPQSATDGEAKADEQQTFLVRKDVCPGMNVGDEIAGRIVAVHDDEYEVVYEAKEAEPDKGPEDNKAPSPVPARDAEMASMMED